jgi:hypothetical protein
MTPERIDLWYTDATQQETDERGRVRYAKKVIHIVPSVPVTKESIQRDVIESLKTILDVAESYYAVFVVRKSDGTLGYRTFIPKTLVRK